MGVVLGLTDDEMAGEQLDRLILVQQAELDQAIVLASRPSTGRQLRNGHRHGVRGRWLSRGRQRPRACILRRVMIVPKALTIAGSDSGGGAGIQADLKTFSAFRVFGMSVLTAITAQNSVVVQGVFNLRPEFVAGQADPVLADFVGVA